VVAERDEARARIDELELHTSALTVALEHTNNDKRERGRERERERERKREREKMSATPATPSTQSHEQ
jgi:hypothetical protein